MEGWRDERGVGNELGWHSIITPGRDAHRCVKVKGDDRDERHGRMQIFNVRGY